jgi:hypothetical protein
MTAVKLLIGLAVAGVASFYLIQPSNLREENQALRLQIEQGSELQAEHQRLSDLIDQTKSSQTLPKEQMSELIRLRGEVGGLRRLTSEMVKLQADNERLIAASKARATNPDLQPSHSLAVNTNQAPDPREGMLYRAFTNNDPERVRPEFNQSVTITN